MARKVYLTVLALILLGFVAMYDCKKNRFGPKQANARTLNGEWNNILRPEYGKKDTRFRNVIKKASTWSHAPNERMIANHFFSEPAGEPSTRSAFDERRYGKLADVRQRNNLMAAFGQFVSNDIAMIKTEHPTKPGSVIEIPIIEQSNDPLYINSAPSSEFADNYPKDRVSTYQSSKIGTKHGVNDVSSFIDVHMIYGLDEQTNRKLRTGIGGLLKLTQEGELVYGKLLGLDSTCARHDPTSQQLFSASGDARTDENPILYALTVLFTREHNRIATEIADQRPDASDDELFAEARKRLIALVQHITYDEYLPSLIGQKLFDAEIGEYTSYDSSIDPSATFEYALGASKVLDDQLSFPLMVLNSSCHMQELPGTLPGYAQIEKSSCIPGYSRAIGSDQILRGALMQSAQAFDGHIADSLLNVVTSASTKRTSFSEPTAAIHKSRENKVGSYYDMRKAYLGEDIYKIGSCGGASRNGSMDAIGCFLAVAADYPTAESLRQLYKKVTRVDAVVGLMLEKKRVPLSDVSFTAAKIIAKQFKDVRNGDRWWYENVSNGLFTSEEIENIKTTTMSDIVRRNTNIPYMSRAAFYVRSGKMAIADICRKSR